MSEKKTSHPSELSLWFKGARPNTWANALAPVIAGTAAAASIAQVDFLRAFLAACVALALIIGVNYANDYSDGVKGTDTDRVGPLRLTASGLVDAQKVKNAALFSFAVAAIFGILLSLLSSWWLILVGLVCILAAWFYTGGKNPYGYRGLGEVSVFIFFGLVAVLGTQFTQAGRITWVGVVLAIGMGAMSASVNLANNIRDIPGDTVSGKNTIAVRLGSNRARNLWAILNLLPIVGTILLGIYSPWCFLGLVIIIPLYTAAIPIKDGAEGPALIPVLKNTGYAMLLWALINCAVMYAINYF